MKGKAPTFSKPKYPQTGKMKQSFSPSFSDDEYIGEGEDMSTINNNDASNIEDITADADISHTVDDVEKETIEDEEEEDEINQEEE